MTSAVYSQRRVCFRQPVHPVTRQTHGNTPWHTFVTHCVNFNHNPFVFVFCFILFLSSIIQFRGKKFLSHYTSNPPDCNRAETADKPSCVSSRNEQAATLYQNLSLTEPRLIPQLENVFMNFVKEIKQQNSEMENLALAIKR